MVPTFQSRQEGRSLTLTSSISEHGGPAGQTHLCLGALQYCSISAPQGLKSLPLFLLVELGAISPYSSRLDPYRNRLE